MFSHKRSLETIFSLVVFNLLLLTNLSTTQSKNVSASVRNTVQFIRVKHEARHHSEAESNDESHGFSALTIGFQRTFLYEL